MRIKHTTMNEREVKELVADLNREVQKLDKELSANVKELMRKSIALKCHALFVALSTVTEVHDKSKEMIDSIEGYYHEQQIIKQGL